MLVNGDDAWLKNTCYSGVVGVESSEICRISTIFLRKIFKTVLIKGSHFEPGNTKKGSENNPYMNLLTFHYTKPSIIFQSYKSVKHVVSTSLFAVDN